MAYRHIVLFRVRDEVDDARLHAAVLALKAFAHFPGVESWVITSSLDARKGRIVIEDATFADREAFDAFRRDDGHVRVGRMMSDVSDWWIGDYVTPVDE